jgi:pyruvate dehydrogenase E2 component (dihydrolipoamide acetyltransferase)/2-oxoisovalerate dehydrogenase E2 component (dihydrolipoyl transacylase)
MEFKLPEIGEGVYEAELTRWLVQPGQTVKRGQDLLEVMTDKATMNVPSPFAGTVLTLAATPGMILKVGQPVLTYRSVEDAVPVAATVEKAVPVRTAVEVPVNGTYPTPVASRVETVPAKASPSVRLMARRLGINLASVAGSGPDGRILIEDLTRKLEQRTPTTTVVPVPEEARKKPVDAGLPDLGKPGTRMKLVGLRRLIAEQMTRSKRTIPDYTYVEEVEVTELVRLREQVRQPYYKAGVKLTYLPFWVKAVVAALKEVPLVNATLDEANNEIILHDRYHIGVAVSTPGGLMVPVLHDADKMDLGTIARELERLSTEARNGTIKRDNLRGGTFTITSIGNLGGLISTPVINHPEVGILGVGKMVRRPVYDQNGDIRPADLVYFSYTFDHRVIDGAVCIQFSNAVVKQLANPVAMLLPEKL